LHGLQRVISSSTWNPLVFHSVPSTTKVATIVLNWNGLRDTIECLESLRTITGVTNQVYVVDNGSDGNDADIIQSRFPEAIVIRNRRNLGFCKGNNVAIVRALRNGADYILLLNNDTVVIQPDFLRRLVETAEGNHRVGVVSPKILYWQRPVVWCAGGTIVPLIGPIMNEKGRPHVDETGLRRVDYVTGCAMLLKRELIKRVGLLWEKLFLYYDDVDYCERARRAGYDSFVLLDSLIAHKKSASSGIRGSTRLTRIQAYFEGRNMLLFAYGTVGGFKGATMGILWTIFRSLINFFRCTNGYAVIEYIRGMIHGTTQFKQR